MKKTVLITGSKGFIGRSLIETLDKNVYEVFALDNRCCSEEEVLNIKDYFTVDITKPFKLDAEFDAIVHLAALNQTNINSNHTYDTYRDVNVTGTLNLINSCRFKKFIYFSTANLYDKNKRLINEDSPLKPVSFYEQSKYEAELILKEFTEDEKLIVFRPVNIAGINQENKAIIPFFFSKAIKNEPIEIFVPRNRRLQLLSVKDVLRAIELGINTSGIAGTFNLSNKDSIEIEKLAQRIITLCNSNSNIIYTCNDLEEYSQIISEKAERLMKWEAADSIDTILNEYARIFIHNRILI